VSIQQVALKRNYPNAIQRRALAGATGHGAAAGERHGPQPSIRIGWERSR